MPTSADEQFFAGIEQALDRPLSPAERQLLWQRRFPTEYAGAANDGERQDTADRAIELVVSPPIEVRRPRDSAKRDDARWALLADLGLLHDAPIVVERVAGWSFEASDSHAIRLTFDARVSKQALIVALTEMWPRLRSEGWVRPTRAMEDRKLALVRYVCLESGLDTSWRERCAGWNATHGEWTYSDVRAMRSDFDRAERSLTGRKWGLARFYSPEKKAALEKDFKDLNPRERRALNELFRERVESATRLRRKGGDTDDES